MKQLLKGNPDRILLFFLLILAACIRFYDPFNLPFMHDELSALIRAQAGSFSELIMKAETQDVHPVGMHVFVHYWSAWFGQNELVVKLPFILMGIAAIWFAYKIAEKWFNSTTALFTAAFMATLQFTTMYGQLERPYASGIFFCTWMVWCWSEFFLGHKKSLIGFVIAATLCCYNHYFSTLFAGMVGITGLFFLNKENRLKYLLSCAIVLLLFLPQIPIAEAQFSTGQTQQDWWMTRPDWTWPIHFTKYLFHFSYFVYALVFVLLALSLTFYRNEKRIFSLFRTICFLWVTIPFLVIFIYSQIESPILQLSSMTFSLPFLLMLLFSFFRDISTMQKTIAVAAIVLVNTCSLFGERKHHKVFYGQAYEEMARMSTEMIREQGAENVASAHAIMGGFMDYYKKKYGEFDFLLVGKPDFKAFEEYVISQKGNYFVAGNLPGEYISIIKKYYPCLVKRQESFTSWVDCFSRDKTAGCLKEHARILNLPEDYTEGGGEGKLILGNIESFLIDETKLKVVSAERYCDLNIFAEIQNKTAGSNPVLVCEMDDEEKRIFWMGAEYNSFRNEDGKATLIISIPLRDFDPAKFKEPKVKIYLWNKDKGEILLERTRVEIIESNRYVYGLYEPF